MTSPPALPRLLQFAPVAVTSLDLQGIVLHVNRALIEASGYSQEQIKGRPFSAFLDPVGEASANADFTELAAGRRESYRAARRYRTRSGEMRDADLSVSLVRGADGAPMMCLAVVQDVTEHARALRDAALQAAVLSEAERSLRLSEARYRTLVEQSPLSVQILSPEGRTVQVNAAWERLWGVTLEQLGDYNLLKDAQVIERGLMPVIQGAFDGEPGLLPAVLYDPDRTIPDLSAREDPRRWVRAVIYPVKDEHGAVREVVLIHEDITDQMRADEQRSQATELLQLVVQQSGEAIIVSDTEGVLRIFNPASERLHGIAGGATPQAQWAERYNLMRTDGSPLPLEETPLFRAVKGDTVVDARWLVRRPDGSTRTLLGLKSRRRSGGWRHGGKLNMRAACRTRFSDRHLQAVTKLGLNSAATGNNIRRSSRVNGRFTAFYTRSPDDPIARWLGDRLSYATRMKRAAVVLAAVATLCFSLAAEVPASRAAPARPLEDRSAPARPLKDREDAANWPQWRGPAGLGVSPAADYPEDWAPKTETQAAKNIAWQTAVPGRGHSSPVVWGNRLFVTISVEGDLVPGHTAPDHMGFDMKGGYLHADSTGVDHKYALKVLAYDTRNGKLLWEKTSYDGLMYDNRHKKNTYASSTIATDGTRLYAFFEAAGLYAYDVDGTLAWKASLGNIAKAGMGPGTSPIIYEDLVILQIDQEMGAGSAIVAIDQKTGKERWRAARSTRRSWATPLIVRTPIRTEMIASGAEVIVSYDPATGRELWHAPGVQSHPIPSAVASNGVVFLSAGSQAKRAVAIRLGGAGDLKDSPSIVWRYDKGTAYVPSPIVYRNSLYLMSDKGLITCLDALTGQLKYEGGRPPVPSTFTASLVAYGDRLLQTSEDGDTFVVKAGPAHEIIRTNTVGEPVYASLALAGGTIYIRGERHLFAIRKP